jgi:hypothetical protein
LVFSRPRLIGSPTHLLFGDGTAIEVPALEPTAVQIAVTLSAGVQVSASAHAAQPTQASAVVTLPGVVTVLARAAVPVRLQALVRLEGGVAVSALAYAEPQAVQAPELTSRDLVFSQPPLTGSPTALVFGVEVAAPVPTTALDLVFSKPPLKGSPTALVFGEEGTAVEPEPVTLITADIYALLGSEVEVMALAAVPVRADAVVMLHSPVAVTAAAIYDNRVTPWLDSRAAAHHQTAVPDGVALNSAWALSAPQRQSPAQRWQTAQPAVGQADALFDAARTLRQRGEAAWQRAEPVDAQAAAAHQKAVPNTEALGVKHQVADTCAQQAASALQTGVFQALQHGDTWQWAQAKVRDLTGRSGASRRLRGVTQVSFPWQVAGHPKNGKSAWPLPQPEGPTVYPRDGHLLFECPPLTVAHLVFGPRACYLLPFFPGAVAVPVLRTYVTINSITLRRVDGDVAIPAYAFQMSLDVESWTWSWSASVPADALPLVQPASDGQPVEVEALVNGVPYRLYAEGVSSQRQFGQARIAVKGRGKAAMLDAPYAPSLNFGNTEPRTAQQLITDVLSVNGVGVGWAVDWRLTDWLVPGNTWTHQGAYISAVTAIAQAAGGYVQPHDTAQTLRILPRYPAAPWSWAGVTPDFELPSSVIAVEGIDWTRKADYNRVFVSGVTSGVLGQVTRAGTAGDSVAPMVTDTLITHADAARQRGLAILSDTGQQARVTLTLPVLAETGLIKPGQFVRYLDGGQSRLGLVRSTSLAWSRPKLRQTIAVETHA